MAGTTSNFTAANNPLGSAWREASKDLGIEFVAPFDFIDLAGKRHICTGLLPHFGSTSGTLITSQFDEDSDTVYDDIQGLGFYYSALSPYHYYSYNREKFVDTLRDWGWFGPESLRPNWL